MTHEVIWEAEDIIHAVHGQCLHEQSWVAHGISIDSRSTKPGDLFIALKDMEYENITAAFEAGAVAAIVSRQVHMSSQAPLIFVPDTFKALEDLGQAARKRSSSRVITMSGAVECKHMLQLMLNEVGETYGGENDLDDQTGIPLALAHMPRTSSYGIFQVTTTGAEKLKHLSQHVQPDIALIAAPDANYPDNFLSMETMSGDKAQIFSAMPANGVAILDRRLAEFALLSAAAKKQGPKRILSYGRDSKADAQLLDYIETPEGATIKADIVGRKIKYNLSTSGVRPALDSVGALCAAVAAGGDLENCAAALVHYRPSKNVDVIERISVQEGGFTLIDKIGDADRTDIRFTLRVLGQMQPGLGGQRMLVLGNAAPYPGLAQDIADAGVTCVFCFGALMHDFYQALPRSLQGFYGVNGMDVALRIEKTVEAGDIVMINAPNGTQSEAILTTLRTIGYSAQQKIAI